MTLSKAYVANKQRQQKKNERNARPMVWGKTFGLEVK